MNSVDEASFTAGYVVNPDRSGHLRQQRRELYSVADKNRRDTYSSVNRRGTRSSFMPLLAVTRPSRYTYYVNNKALPPLKATLNVQSPAVNTFVAIPTRMIPQLASGLMVLRIKSQPCILAQRQAPARPSRRR